MTPRTTTSLRTALLRVATGLVLAGLLAGTTVVLGGAGTPAVANTTSTSPLTVAATGTYAGLEVTVSQSRDLINQAVTVSWKGGRPTSPVGGFGAGFLQIMQCWADDGAQPTREQCQFGGNPGDARAVGGFLSSRQVSYGSTLVDPLETYRQPSQFVQAYVPFRSVTGDLAGVDTASNEFFDASTTNELAFGRTRADGTGVEVFETQTLREAPGLGCGTARKGPDGRVTGRGCFLVAVPRGTTEVDGTTRQGGISTVARLSSSPLAQTNWANRLVLPLSFAPVGEVCPLGAAERRTVGEELIAEAITSWQPVLCAGDGAVYGFSRVPDSVGRNQLQSSAPGLVFLSRPLGSGEAPTAGPVSYAPVALSGLTVAYVIDSRAKDSATAAVKAADGTRLTSLRLTPRLVAKLLTQSYRLASPAGRSPATAENPSNLAADPEFLALNPGFADLRYSSGLADVLVPSGQAESTRRVWAWLQSDPEASAFLGGADDGFGMTINPAYLGQTLPRDDYPKSDPYCAELEPGQPPLCTLDQAPYAADLFEAARAAGRGDTLSRTSFDPLAIPPRYRKDLPQPSGQRQLMALVDTAAAERFGLATAELRNASGQFVAPTGSTLLAGLAASRPAASAQVLEPVPSAGDPAAYPLTTLTYAATVPAALEPEAAGDFAELLRYAAGPGQVPGVAAGQLPGGYVPLPATATQQTLAVAAALEVAARPRPTASPSLPPASASPPPPLAPVLVAGAPIAQPAAPAPLEAPPIIQPAGSAPQPPPAQPFVPAPAFPALAPPAPFVPPASSEVAAPTEITPVSITGGTASIATGTTPVTPAGGTRYALLLALGLGGVAAGSSALLRRVTGRTGA